jgi:hypothetical protein
MDTFLFLGSYGVYRKHNWLIRNQVDYNNLFEINYYDILKHGTQSYISIPSDKYYLNGVTYSSITYTIPERTISIGVWSNTKYTSWYIKHYRE